MSCCRNCTEAADARTSNESTAAGGLATCSPSPLPPLLHAQPAVNAAAAGGGVPAGGAFQTPSPAGGRVGLSAALPPPYTPISTGKAAAAPSPCPAYQLTPPALLHATSLPLPVQP